MYDEKNLSSESGSPGINAEMRKKVLATSNIAAGLQLLLRRDLCKKSTWNTSYQCGHEAGAILHGRQGSDRTIAQCTDQ